MEKIEYENACCEVLEILRFLPEKDINKIPNNIIDVIKSNVNKSYHFIYNPNKTLDEQNVSKIAKTIIALFYRDYWATQEKKIKILEFQKNIFNQIEKEKKEKYNIDFLTKRKNNIETFSLDNKALPMETQKYNFIKKIIYRIKQYFMIK